MNKVHLMGRLVKNPDTRAYKTRDGGTSLLARWILAVDRRPRSASSQEADFIRCVAFGKTAEAAEANLARGMQIIVSGRLRTESYTDADNRRQWVTNVYVDEWEFTEKKEVNQAHREAAAGDAAAGTDENGFMNVPDGIEEELPFR